MRFRGTRALSFWMLLVAGGLLLQIGCQPGGPSGPTGTVSGKVTLDGQPVPPGSVVTFMSQTGAPAMGNVGADGTYQLMTGGKPQVPAGKYMVTVTDPPAPAMSQAEIDNVMKGGKAEAPKASGPVIPAKFASATASGLSFEVKAGANTFNIELKK